MTAKGTPDADVAIDAMMVKGLLTDQHPDLAHLPITPVDSGWDNAIFRLGDRLAVRLPRRQIAAQLIEHEQIWLPRLATPLPISIPIPHRTGQPALGYPWRWSIVPWLPGVAADAAEPHPSQAQRLGEFLRSLHQPAPADAPQNPVRGIPLTQRATAVDAEMQRLEQKTDAITPQLRSLWQEALAAPIDVPATWLHGDLHARNVLVNDGIITGIIDWGDITAGDRATDLAAFWMLFADKQARQEAIAAYGGISDATLHRAKGWAIRFGVILLETGLVDHSRHALMGARTLQRVID